MESRPIRFIVAAYGTRYVGLLLTCLYSIQESNKRARTTVLWQDMPEEKIDALTAAFPTVEFIEGTHLFAGNSTSRIAQKTHLWRAGAHAYKDERRVFIDVDTFVLKDIESFFTDYEFDIGFTRKEDIYPLNTGVMLVRGETGTAFFDEWVVRTERILHDREAMRQASSRAYLYGAPDQMALYQFISYDPAKTDFSATTEQGVPIHFRAFPCALLNFVHSGPITEDMYIIHYKSGLQKILIDGTGFTRKRTKEDSWDMYCNYLKTYKKAVEQIARVTNTAPAYTSYGITIPFYFSKDLVCNPSLYALFDVKEKIRYHVSNIVIRVWSRLRAFLYQRVTATPQATQKGDEMPQG